MEKSQGQLSQGKCIAIVLIRKGLQPAMVSASCKLGPLTGRPQQGEGSEDVWGKQLNGHMCKYCSSYGLLHKPGYR